MLTIQKIAHTEIAAELNRNDLLVLRATINGGCSAANPEFLGETVKTVADEMKCSRQNAKAFLAQHVNEELSKEFAPVLLVQESGSMVRPQGSLYSTH
jgi:hypothetical protein